jgi:hypothetical protein
MKTVWKLLLGAALAGVAWVVVAAPGLVLGAGGCENTTLAQAVSPRGAHRAVVFARSCGATTGFSTQVSVVPARAGLANEGGNVFVADTDHGAAPSGPGGGPVVEVAWLDESRLVIRHDPRARVFHSEPRAGAVQVTYERR